MFRRSRFESNKFERPLHMFGCSIRVEAFKFDARMKYCTNDMRSYEKI